MIIDRVDVGFSSANTTGYVLGEMVILGGFQVDFWNLAPKETHGSFSIKYPQGR